jgi:hypothetical protein
MLVSGRQPLSMVGCGTSREARQALRFCCVESQPGEAPAARRCEFESTGEPLMTDTGRIYSLYGSAPASSGITSGLDAEG